MNREIKFRGKRADNGEWVYGYLSEHNVINVDISKDGDAFNGVYEYFIVIPETVGQLVYIDKLTGKEYFEGDKDADGGVLMYDEELCLFAMHSYYSILNKWSPSSYPIDFRRVKIIGTIHD